MYFSNWFSKQLLLSGITVSSRGGNKPHVPSYCGDNQASQVQSLL